MMTEAKILLKALEGCIQDAMDGAPIVRAKYMSRYRLVLNVLQSIENSLIGYERFSPLASDERVSEVVRKLALGIRHQSAARSYLRFAEVVVEEILSRIHREPGAAERIKQHYLTLLSLLVIVDSSNMRMYKSYSSYINYVAGELGITTAHQLLRWKALDLVTFRLTEGEHKVEFIDASVPANPIAVRSFDAGDLARAAIQATAASGADPAAATPHPLADFAASRQRSAIRSLVPYATTTNASATDAYTIHPYPPNARPRMPSNGASGAWIPS